MSHMMIKIGCLLIVTTVMLAFTTATPETTPETPPPVPSSRGLVSEPTSELKTTAEPTDSNVDVELNRETTHKATTSEIVIPPLVIIVIIVGGLGLLMASSKFRRKAKLMKRRVHQQFLSRKSVKSFICLQDAAQSVNRKESGQTSVDEIRVKIMGKEAFFTESDIEAIDTLFSFFNQPLPLIVIALPALVSLAFCPLVLFLYAPMCDLFWPKSDFPNGQPDINDAVACFLVPAGLVYATSFGFSFQGAMQKQRALLNNISLEVGLLDQIMVLASSLNNATCKERLQIYRIVKEEAVSIILQIQGKVKYSSSDYKSNRSSGQVWKILKILDIVTGREEQWSADRELTNKMLDLILHLNTACSDRDETLQAIIHPLKWIFLECLGFFSFFGVLLLQAESHSMKLAMCIITVFSISLLCYVVADFDSPFNGFFKVNVTALIEVVDKAEDMYLLTLDGKDPYQMRARQLSNNSSLNNVGMNIDDEEDDTVVA